MRINWREMYKTYHLIVWYLADEKYTYNVVCWSKGDQYIVEKWVAGTPSKQLIFTDPNEANNDIKREFSQHRLYKRSREDVVKTLNYFDWFNESEAYKIY